MTTHIIQSIVKDGELYLTKCINCARPIIFRAKNNEVTCPRCGYSAKARG